MSGHSKWATIKHKKGAADAKRGRVFTKLIREITVAARMGGGDPGSNPRLRKAISDAKTQQMPADTINRAVKRGTGELEGASYEEVLYEGTGPGGTLLLIEGLTDNRNRTVAELRKIFEKHNGTLGSSGTAAWAFDRKGVFRLDGSVAEDTLMDVAVGAGADDYENSGDVWQVVGPVEVFDAVGKALEAASITVQESALEYLPKNRKPVVGRDAEVVLNLTDALDDHDDVQHVYADFDISDEEMARISSE
ncbi:MAG: YebC/PmpR family DNA-binding transcriptional regulator [Polyangiaceae bacterium]|nr:YebC/PmpR family DNA-binding transcriptional regulator [Polyangiaceae bacterium]